MPGGELRLRECGSSSSYRAGKLSSTGDFYPLDELGSLPEEVESLKQTPKTSMFRLCLGVFEGGGVKGAALAGAYAEAYRRGVRFSRVAGTSAGSIVAALVAAGASPEVLKEVLQSKPFSSLLRPAGREAFAFSNYSPWKTRALNLFSKTTRQGSLERRLVSAIYYGGSHSVSGIQDWVGEMLVELVESRRRTGAALLQVKSDGSVIRNNQHRDPHVKPVTFAELELPLYVVATDLRQSKAKVFKAPDDGVAAAVACSCSIPLFFQPKPALDSFYVDGGLVSNVPGFAFFEDENETPSELILAFRLLGQTQTRWKEQRPNSLEDLIGALAESLTVACDIQLNLMPNVYAIPIDTKHYLATDFSVGRKELGELFNLGENSARDFFENERKLVQASQPMVSGSDLGPWNLHLVRAILFGQAETCLVCQSALWVRQALPALLSLRVNAPQGRLRIFLPVRKEEDTEEVYWRWMLYQLGAEVAEVECCTLEAFYCRSADDRVFAGAAQAKKANQYDLKSWACAWGQSALSLAIEAYLDLLSVREIARHPAADAPVKVEMGSFDEWGKRLIQANQSLYSTQTAGGRRSLPAQAVYILGDYRRAHLLEAWSAWRQCCEEKLGLNCLEPLEISLPGGVKLNLPPIVFEKLNDRDYAAVDELAGVRAHVEILGRNASNLDVLALPEARYNLGQPYRLSEKRQVKATMEPPVSHVQWHRKVEEYTSTGREAAGAEYTAALRSVGMRIRQSERTFLGNLRQATQVLLGHENVWARVTDALFLLRYCLLPITASRLKVDPKSLEQKINANLMVRTNEPPAQTAIRFASGSPPRGIHLTLIRWACEPSARESQERFALPADRSIDGLTLGAPYAFYVGVREFIADVNPSRLQELLARENITPERQSQVLDYFQSHPELRGFVSWPVPFVNNRDRRWGVVNIHWTEPGLVTQEDVQTLEEFSEIQRLFDSLGRDCEVIGRISSKGLSDAI